MSQDWQILLELMALEKIDENSYRGNIHPTLNNRLFGGQVLAQSMRAAQETVSPERTVHSQHAYFLRPGDSSQPIIFDVDNIRDGKSFTTRRVVASQHGRAIFNTSLSFQISESGLNHQIDMPQCPPPEELQDENIRWNKILEAMDSQLATNSTKRRPSLRPIDIRPVEPVDYLNPTQRPPEQFIWMKAKGLVEENNGNNDSALHHAILAYASDFSLMSTSLLPHGKSIIDQNLHAASLDHAIWFHDSFRVDEWLLYHMHSSRSSASRGLSRGSLYSRDGRLVASTIQEGLIRIAKG